MISLLITVVGWAFDLYTFALFIYVMMSWFPTAYSSSFGQFLTRICEPYLRLFDFVPPIGGISFAPMVAIIVLGVMQYGINGLLVTLFTAL